MGRVFEKIRCNGRSLWVRFDTGATRTYVTAPNASQFKSQPLDPPLKVGLGGKTQNVRRICFLMGTLEGRKFHTMAHVVGTLGTDEQGRPIDVLFGATAMEEWCIHVKPKERKVDLTQFKREFTEY